MGFTASWKSQAPEERETEEGEGVGGEEGGEGQAA